MPCISRAPRYSWVLEIKASGRMDAYPKHNGQIDFSNNTENRFVEHPLVNAGGK